MHHDAETTNNLTMLWSENHQQKMKRMASRLDYLFEENQLLQERLHMDRDKHVEEMRRLDEQYQIAKAKTTEAKQVLQLERAYYDTCVNLLEAGLERETKKVEALKEKLQFQRLRDQRRQGHRIDEQLPIRTRQQQDQQQQYMINQFGPSEARPFQPYSSSRRPQQQPEQAQWHPQPHHEPLRHQYHDHHHHHDHHHDHQYHNGHPSPPQEGVASSSRYVQSNNNIKSYSRSTGSSSSSRRRRNNNDRYTISSMDGYDFRTDDNMMFFQ
jgi:hypothetical protein